MNWKELKETIQVFAIMFVVRLPIVIIVFLIIVALVYFSCCAPPFPP